MARTVELVKKKDLQKGKFYVGFWESSSLNEIIFLYSGDLKGSNHFINTIGVYEVGGCCWGSKITFRKATDDEKISLLEEIGDIPLSTGVIKVDYMKGSRAYKFYSELKGKYTKEKFKELFPEIIYEVGDVVECRGIKGKITSVSSEGWIWYPALGYLIGTKNQPNHHSPWHPSTSVRRLDNKEFITIEEAEKELNKIILK